MFIVYKRNVSLQHVSARIGHHQEYIVSKYTEKNYYTVSCANLMIPNFTVAHFLLKGNVGCM
jgi:hypothetical protein